MLENSMEPFLNNSIENHVPKRSHKLVRLLKITGLYFGEYTDGAFWYFINLFRSILLITLSKLYYKSSYREI